MNLSTHKQRKRSEQGFTLLEMVIAVTLVAMMAVAIWAVFRISVASWARGTQSVDTNQRHRSILDLVKKQMASMYGLIAPVELRAGGAVALYPIFAGTETSMQFISLSSLRFQANPGLTMVSYDVVHDQNGDYLLAEREAQYLGMGPSRESIFDRKEQPVVTIFENLTSFRFEYFDPGTNERPSQWVTEWNAREVGRLPAAISMTMICRDSSGGTFGRHMVVPIMAKPYDPRTLFINPFESRPRRYSEDDPRFVR